MFDFDFLCSVSEANILGKIVLIVMFSITFDMQPYIKIDKQIAQYFVLY